MTTRNDKRLIAALVKTALDIEGPMTVGKMLEILRGHGILSSYVTVSPMMKAAGVVVRPGVGAPRMKGDPQPPRTPPRHKQPPPPKALRAAEMWRAGHNWAEIAEALADPGRPRLSRQRVQQLLARAGIRPAQQKRQAIEEAAREALAEDAYAVSVVDIIRRLKARGVATTHNTVAPVLADMGIKARSNFPKGCPGPGHLHCPGCGWQPLDRFMPAQQARQENGIKCRACRAALQRRQYADKRRNDGSPADG